MALRDSTDFWPRAFGIHTGMRLKQARTLCPGVIQRPARPGVYAQVQAQAAQQGYRISSLAEGRAFVHEPRSFYGMMENEP